MRCLSLCLLLAAAVALPAAETILTRALRPGILDQPYQQHLQATTAAGPVTWQIAAGTLPAGITLDPASGLLSGTPSEAGRFWFEVVVANDLGSSQPRRFHLRVRQPASAVALGTSWQVRPAPLHMERVSDVALGYDHSLALTTAGTVRAWGLDDEGQLQVPADVVDVVAIAAAGDHSLALRSDGKVIAWGADTRAATVPPGIDDVVAIATSTTHSLALRSDGTLVHWGSTSQGVADGVESITDAIAIATGNDYSLIVRGDGYVTELGDDLPTDVRRPGDLTSIVDVAVGDGHALAIDGSGRLYAWGYNRDGQCDIPPELPTDIVDMAAGPRSTTALSADGTLHQFGRSFLAAGEIAGVHTLAAGYRHLLVVAHDPPRLQTPSRWEVLIGEGLSRRISATPTGQISYQALGLPPGLAIDHRTGVVTGSTTAVGSHHVLIEASNPAGTDTAILLIRVGHLVIDTHALPEAREGHAYDHDLVGRGTSALIWQVPSETLPPGLSLDPITGRLAGTPTIGGRFLLPIRIESIQGTAQRQLLLDVQTRGELTAWGADAVDQASPPPSIGQAVDIAVGRRHSLAILPDGQVAAWGDPDADRLAVPGGLDQAWQIAAGDEHSLAMTADDRLVAWGGRSGSEPVPTGLAHIAQVSAGGPVSAVLMSDGRLALWGDVDYEFPASPWFSGIQRVSVGPTHVLALHSSGAVLAWGDNSHGQCWVPGPLPDVIDVAAGDGHSLALLGDGSIVAWGRNSSAQSLVPASVTPAAAIAGGAAASFAIDRHGGLHAWGLDRDGQTSPPQNLPDVLRLASGSGSHLLVLTERAPTLAGPLHDVIPVGLPFARVMGPSDGTVEHFAAEGLPPGLTIDPITGVVSGTPTATGTASVTMTATNSAGSSTMAWTIEVVGELRHLALTVAQDGQVHASHLLVEHGQAAIYDRQTERHQVGPLSGRHPSLLLFPLSRDD